MHYSEHFFPESNLRVQNHHRYRRRAKTVVIACRHPYLKLMFFYSFEPEKLPKITCYQQEQATSVAPGSLFIVT